jgi:arylsulfatase A-like enzyme
VSTRSSARTLAISLVAATVAGVVDGVFAVAAGAHAWTFVVAAAGTFALIGTLPAAGLVAGARAGARWWGGVFAGRDDRRRASAGAAIAAASTCAALVLAGLAQFERKTPPEAVLALTALGAGAVGLGALLGLGAHRLLRSPLAVRAVLGLAAVGVVIVAVVFVPEWGSELDLRFLGPGGALVLALGLGSRARAQGAVRRAAIVCAPLVVVGPGLLVHDATMRRSAARYAPLGGELAAALGRLADLDGDGFSPLSGQPDCAPFDGDVFPFGDEIPGNGIDDDCHGGDVALSDAIRPIDEDPPAPIDRPRPDLLLVTIEAVRADHVGSYGYARDTTPRLDAWAASAAAFEHAYTTSPVTDRALASFVGGLYPTAFSEAQDYWEHAVDPRRVLLAERLADAGYETGAIHSFRLFSEHGLDQGIEKVALLTTKATQDARACTTRAIRMWKHLRERDGPAFLWVHYYEPHSRYTPPEAHRAWGGERPLDLYDAELRYVDQEIGRLLDAVAATQSPRGTLVVVTSDHGEEFGDHGGKGHARQLYDESVRVPLWIAGPGISPRRIGGRVSLVDLMPTVLDLLEIPVPAHLQGVSQAAVLRGGELVRRPIFIEQYRHGSERVQKLAVVDGDDKLLFDRDAQLFELYDLRADPAELDDRADAEPALRAELAALLLDHWQAARAALGG